MHNDILDSSELKILICCHKKAILPNLDDYFLPIHVGAKNSNAILNIQNDFQINDIECVNISEKNPSYCELTAMFWAWKNIKKLYPNLKYIGLNHYRRYFSQKNVFKYIDRITMAEDKVSTYQLNIRKISKKLLSNNAIVPIPIFFPHNLFTQYALCHYSDDLRIIFDVIKELYPEYEKDTNFIFYSTNKFRPYNMFIMDFNDYSNYCEWLFSILFVLEKRINIQNYSDRQKRIYGFMAERLFNLWLYHNRVKIFENAIIFYSNEDKHHSNKKFNRIFIKTLSLKGKIKLLLYNTIPKFLQKIANIQK